MSDLAFAQLGRDWRIGLMLCRDIRLVRDGSRGLGDLCDAHHRERQLDVEILKYQISHGSSIE